MKPVRSAARGMLAAIFIGGGWNQLRSAAQHVEMGRPVIDRAGSTLRAVHPKAPSDPQTLVMIDGAAKLGGGLLLATGRAPRTAALVLASSLVPTTLAAHSFWQVKDPQERMQQRIHFLKNAGLLGGLLLAAVDTEGRPNVSWRARHLAKQTRRTTGGLAEAVTGTVVGAVAGVGAGVGAAARKATSQTTAATRKATSGTNAVARRARRSARAAAAAGVRQARTRVRALTGRGRRR